MTWSQGHRWTAEVELPCSQAYFYKYVIEEDHGRQSVEWQQGSNRVLTVPDLTDPSAGPLIEAHDCWSGDPVTSSVMQTTTDFAAGAKSWPTSAEQRLKTFVETTNVTLKSLREDLLRLAESIGDEDREGEE